jgi:2,5-diketo-D-gluconate reductase A
LRRRQRLRDETREVAAIDGLDTGKRGGPERDAITLESFGRQIPEA